MARLVRLIRRERVSVVHTHSSVDAWLGGMAARASGVPVVRTRHVSIAIRRGFNPVYTWLADRVITSGEAIRRLVVAAGAPADRVVAIPAGVDLADFPFRQRSDDAGEGARGLPSCHRLRRHVPRIQGPRASGRGLRAGPPPESGRHLAAGRRRDPPGVGGRAGARRRTRGGRGVHRLPAGCGGAARDHGLLRAGLHAHRGRPAIVAPGLRRRRAGGGDRCRRRP